MTAPPRPQPPEPDGVTHHDHDAASHLEARDLLERLLAIRSAALNFEAERRADIEAVPSDQRDSALNLVHYLAVRRVDLRRDQQELSRLGLSSLGRAEGHILATLDAVICRLATDTGAHGLPADLGARGPDSDASDEMLRLHSEWALGPAPRRHDTRVMVTLPAEAATDPTIARRLVAAGMSIARINCAHDDPRAWRAMADHVRAAASAAGRDVRVAFDLPGPKLRTGPIAPGPDVVRARPRRDQAGAVLAPARIVFHRDGAPGVLHRDGGPGAGPFLSVPLDAELVEVARPGDELYLRDARNSKRRLAVVSVDDGGLVAQCPRTVYLTSGIEVQLRRAGEVVTHGALGRIPAAPGYLSLSAGDVIELHHGTHVGRRAIVTPDGAVEPAVVGVELDEVFEQLRPGHRVLFDDGEIHGVARECSAGRVVVEIVHPASAKLRSDKGINLPDTTLPIPALTDDDLRTLEVVAPLADLVALSFVDDPADVERLHDRLDSMGVTDVGVVLKIERRSAFEALPELLLSALARPPVAVMVARGDLAAEVGFERLAEVQEEILWLSEAAHVPVIWATQVLETLAKRGSPTRAEVTDAAWAARAECVMLNKGPHIDEALTFLDDVLSRMRGHQAKRTPLLRALAVAAPPPPAPPA